MRGLRCPDCGETRWHLMPVRLAEEPKCTICGGAMLTERRRPGRGRDRDVLVTERREQPAATSAP